MGDGGDMITIRQLREQIKQLSIDVERLEAEIARQRLGFEVERQRLETENARLLGELRILDAAGKINRNQSEGER